MPGVDAHIARLKDISKKVAKEKTKSKDLKTAEKSLNEAIAEASAIVAQAANLETAKTKLFAAIDKHNTAVSKASKTAKDAVAEVTKGFKDGADVKSLATEAGSRLLQVSGGLPKVEKS
jgi:predicted  nucleic acid-binding Zn-ribbon protein